MTRKAISGRARPPRSRSSEGSVAQSAALPAAGERGGLEVEPGAGAHGEVVVRLADSGDGSGAEGFGFRSPGGGASAGALVLDADEGLAENAALEADFPLAGRAFHRDDLADQRAAGADGLGFLRGEAGKDEAERADGGFLNEEAGGQGRSGSALRAG